jgi:RNA polymerase sigma-70 factor (ECF subfamily)
LPDARVRAAELFQQYGPAVYRRCRRLLGDGEAAHDATQEVFVQLVRNMPRLEDRETVLPWVYRVATNHCLNLRRARQRQGLSEAVDLEVLPSPASTAYPDRQLAAAVLSRFDPTTQAIAIAVLVDGMEQQEAAASLGVSTRTVSRKLERFLVNARKYLARSAA